MVEIQAQIEADRRKLEEKKDMAEEEKRKVEEDLQKKEAELKKAQYVFTYNLVNSLVHGIFLMKFQISNYQANFIDWWL